MQNQLLRTLVLLLYVLSVVAPVVAAPAGGKAGDKANVEELLRKADQAALEGKLNVARAGYERAMAAGADLTTDYTRASNLGMIYMNGSPRDFKKAARWLEIAWKMRPTADDTRLALAQALSWSGKHDAAIEHFRALVKKNPDTADYSSGLANTLYWSGKSDEAVAVYERYLERRPSNLPMRLEYARVLSFARKLPESTLQYQSVLQADPNNVQAQIGLAKIASWQDDFKGALDRYNKVLKRHPDLYDAIVGKAYTIYWMGGRDQEAVVLFQDALKRNPNDKEVRATLKEMGVKNDAGKKAAATEQAKAETPAVQAPKPAAAPAETATVLQPETFDSHQRPQARNVIAVMMEQAQAAADAQNYVEAIHLYHEILQREPRNTAAMLQIARVLSWSRNFQQSAHEYDQLLQIEPDNMQARLERARVLSWGENYEASVDEYNRVIKQAEVARAQPAPQPVVKPAVQPKPVEVAKPIEQPKPVEVAKPIEQPKPVEVANPVEQPKPVEVAKPIEQPKPVEVAKPIEQPKPVEVAKPVEQPKPVEVAKPVEQPKPVEVAKPIEQPKPVEVAKPVEQPKPVEVAKPIEQPKPVEVAKPIEQPKPVEVAKPIEQPKPVEVAKPIEQPKPVEVAKPIEQPKPVEVAKPIEQPKPVEVAKPIAQPKPVEVAKPIAQPKPVEVTKPTTPEQPTSVEVATTTTPEPQPEPVERAAPEVAPEPPATNIDVVQTRLELARVLAWSKRYGESLAQFNVILPPEQKPEAKDKPILIEKAKVLSYARNYEEAVKTYDVALALDPSDIDARLGKGQTLYWWGRLDQAANTLRPLMQVQALTPETKTTAAITLAGVEHSRGKNSAALSLLDTTGTTNGDAKDLRRDIREGTRPVLRVAFGWEDDQEVPATALVPPTPPTTVHRELRYSTSLAFNVTPDLRMTVANVVTHGTTSNPLIGQYGHSATSFETEALLDWRANSWLEMIVGAGAGGTGAGSACNFQTFTPATCETLFGSPMGDRTMQFVYDIHPIITKGGFRFEFAAGRHIADYTPLAITANVVRHRFDVNASYNWRNRINYGVEYWHSEFSVNSPQLQPALATNEFSTAGNGAALYVTPTWYRGEHLTIDGGVRWEIFGYDNGALAIAQAIGSGGFFAPSEYQRIAGTGRMVYEKDRFRLDIHGTFGPQRVTGFRALAPPPPAWGTTGSVGTEISGTFGKFRPFIAYDWFDTATAAGAGQTNGAYKSSSLLVGFAYRF
ncbi:MAG: tetratricopeptide repeat protein [Candidatus Koribacter versatilis]|uniref:Tetratricopeptide repeat protein n=1 Tax=Candidatus Korobacter versatilis TaxID=658062 RepID=A0A932ERX8_9BACT|nr:tetratricopeptide repeat protein [Candidatus Koribacter versatilis]